MGAIIYPTSATDMTNLLSPPTYKELVDAGYVQREVIKDTIADTFNQSPFVSSLILMNKGRTSRSKKPEWLVGDVDAATTGLNGDVAVTVKSGTLYAVTLDDTRIPPHSLLALYDSTHGYRSVVSYGTSGVADSKTVWTNGGGTQTFHEAHTTVYVLPTSMPFDGTAGPGVNYGGKFVSNAMQRIRESVQRGPHTETDAMYMKRDLAEFARIKYIALQRQIERQLFLGSDKALMETRFERDGVMGGLDYFGRPGETTGMSDSVGGAEITWDYPTGEYLYWGTGLKGFTSLISGSTISFDTIEGIMEEATHCGSQDRHIFCPPKVARKFTKMARNEKVLESMDWTFPNFPNIVAKVPGFETAFGRVFIHVDRSATGINKYVRNATQYIAGEDWAYVLDMDQFDWITHDVEGKGVQGITLKPVTLNEDNNTIEKAEWDGTHTIANFMPPASGIIIFGTPAGV